jgi:prepilin-type N-terminal cleavage/methylation domain-containing protein
MKRLQAGFTLLEVVVAMTVVGAGFAVGLAAMSGSLRLMRSAGEYEQAMLLARAAMTEALAYPDYDIADDREREVYKGVEYAYRVEFRPVRLVQPAESTGSTGSTGSAGSTQSSGAGATPAPLEQISVDVYWGESRSKNYRLVTYRLRQSASEASQTRARGNTAAGAAAGVTTSDGTVRSGDAGADRPGDRLLENRRQIDRPAP